MLRIEETLNYLKGGDIASTRAWLDKKGFIGIFNNWEAILGLPEEKIMVKVPGERGEMLWGFLNTARRTTGSICSHSSLSPRSISSDHYLRSILIIIIMLIFLAVCSCAKGTIIISKRRASCRYSVYQLAEANHGKVRVGEADDGINYDPNSSDNLRVQLVFGEERSAEDFESQFSRLSNRWHKRPSLSMAVPEMSIESEGVSTVPFSGALTRMMSSNYRKVEKAGDTEVSPADFDQYSWTSIVTGVEVDDEVRLRLMEREDSKALFRQKAQKCYIIGRENKRYESDPNNIVFCSRNLQQQYDAIDSTVGVEQFHLQYVAHDPSPCPRNCTLPQCKSFSWMSRPRARCKATSSYT